MADLLKCPICARAGADMAACGSFTTCPRQGVPLDPTKDMVLHCDACDITRVVSIPAIVHGKGVANLDFICPRATEECQCTAMNAPSPAAKVARGSKA